MATASTHPEHDGRRAIGLLQGVEHVEEQANERERHAARGDGRDTWNSSNSTTLSMKGSAWALGKLDQLARPVRVHDGLTVPSRPGLLGPGS